MKQIKILGFLLAFLPSCIVHGHDWGKAYYHYFIPPNGGKVYCRIVNKDLKTIKIGQFYFGCRYGDSRYLVWGVDRVQEISGNVVLPSQVELRYCDEQKNEDYSVGSYTIVGVEGWAFVNCLQLTSITLPSTVTYVKRQAFKGCSNLTTINFPSTLHEIDLRFAEGCDRLESVNKEKGGGGMYYSINGILCCDRDIVFCPKGYKKAINVPSSIKEIKPDVFADHDQIVSVTLNSDVIGSRAFKNCTSLKTIVLNNGVKEIGEEAFSGCLALEQITIPGSAKNIRSNAFSNCMSLKSVKINEGVDELSDGDFSFCTSLRQISFPSSMKFIGEKAFMGCSALENVVFNPQISLIGRYAFFGCSNLKSVNVPKGATIYEETFMDCNKLHLP